MKTVAKYSNSYANSFPPTRKQPLRLREPDVAATRVVPRLRNNQSELARLIDLIGFNQVNQSKLALYKFKHVANQFNLQDED
jgi:hypothetical protein